MKVIRWPELDIINADVSKLVEDYYFKTDKGYILAGYLFPTSKLVELKVLKKVIDIKKKELAKVEEYIYKIGRDFNS